MFVDYICCDPLWISFCRSTERLSTQMWTWAWKLP